MADDVDFRITARNESKAAFDDAKRGLEGLGQSISNARGLLVSLAAAAGVQQFASLINQATETTARYKDLGEVAGTTAERISGMEIPARLAGKSLDEIASAVAKLGRSLGEARLGDPGKASLFRALGIDPNDGRDAAEVMVDVARALTGMQDKAVAGKVANELLGKSFAELRPFMKELTEQGGLVARVTNDQAEAADRYRDNLTRLSAIAEEARLKFAGELLPALNEVAEIMLKVARETEAFNLAIKTGIVFFQTFAVVGSDVAFVFKMIGGEIGVILAQLAAIARFRPEQAGLIGDEWRRDAAQARVELEAFQARVMAVGKTVADVRDQFDMFGPGGTPRAADGNTAEERVRQRMEFERNYSAMVAEARGFAERYAAAIKVGNELAQEAHKQGLIGQEDLIRQVQANEDARLQVLIQSLEKQKKLHQEKGEVAAAAATQERIAQAEAQRLANEAIANAKVTSIGAMSDEQWKQQLALNIERITIENMGELELLDHHLIAKQNILDMALQQKLISEADYGAQSALLFERTEQKKTNFQRQQEQARFTGLQTALGHTAALMNTQSRAAFEIGKTAALAQAIVSTYLTTQKAFEEGEKINYYLGYVYAAAALAFGLSNVNAIANTHFGSSSASPVYSAMPGTSVPAAAGGGSGEYYGPAPSVPAQGVAATPRSQINITLIGDTHSNESVRELMKKIAEEATYGADIVVNTTR